MQAVVKTPHININIKGEIPKKLLDIIKQEFGDAVYIAQDKDDELIDIFSTEWYKKTKAAMKPGDYIKIYRENHNITQKELGKRLGNIHAQHISNMENGKRNISLKMARKFSKIFNVPIDRFL